MQQEIAAGRVHFGIDETAIPNGKVYLRENEWQAPSSVFYKDRRSASAALKKLVGEKVFDFPKDATVLARFVSMLCRRGDLVLDFFAGSGSTAEAVVRTAAASGTPLRYVLVQLPEPIEEDGRAWQIGLRTLLRAEHRVLLVPLVGAAFFASLYFGLNTLIVPDAIRQMLQVNLYDRLLGSGFARFARFVHAFAIQSCSFFSPKKS
jgi:hypothetical protein